MKKFFLLLIMIVLAACGNRGISEERTQQIEQRAREQAERDALNEPYLQTIEAALAESAAREITNDLMQTVRFDAAHEENLREVTEGIETYFPHSELFRLDEAIARYNEIIHDEQPRELTLLSSLLTADRVFDLIRANTDYFFENAPALETSMYRPLEDDFLRTICEIITDAVNRELAGYNFHPSTIYALEYRLQNLRVVMPLRPMLGTVDNYGLMTISTLSRNTTNRIVLTPEDTKKKLVIHELQHLVQLRSNEARLSNELDSFWGFNFIAEDLGSMMWWWLLEAAAVRLSADMATSGHATSYLNEIMHLDILTQVLITNENMYQHAVPRLTQQPYLQTAFDLFGANTPEREREFLQLMFAIELVTMNRPNSTDFWTLYGTEILGREPNDNDITELRHRLRGAVSTTIAKYFYENLSHRLTREVLPLKDIFTHIVMFEAGLNTKMRYTSRIRHEFFSQFFADYAEIKEAFFTQIADALDISPEELLADYDTFNARTERPTHRSLLNPQEDYIIDFAWLAADKNTFLTRFYNDVIANKTVSVRQFSEIRETL